MFHKVSGLYFGWADPNQLGTYTRLCILLHKKETLSSPLKSSKSHEYIHPNMAIFSFRTVAIRIHPNNMDSFKADILFFYTSRYNNTFQTMCVAFQRTWSGYQCSHHKSFFHHQLHIFYSRWKIYASKFIWHQDIINIVPTQKCLNNIITMVFRD